jgi:hypothetical protein
MIDLQDVLRAQGTSMCKDVIHTIIKEAGYRWRRASVVLTSRDPEYRTKVAAIEKILSMLGQDEAFFSIDEYGPFTVKHKGGPKRVARGENYVVQQWQKSKGWLIRVRAPRNNGRPCRGKKTDHPDCPPNVRLMGSTDQGSS